MNYKLLKIFFFILLAFNINGIKAQIPTEIEKADSTVTDIEGNLYHIKKIGSQFWLTENLKVSKYNNGDIIETTSSTVENISELLRPKFQWVYEGNSNYLKQYGRLYTWYVVSDSRGVCPSGWHVPSVNDWDRLMESVGKVYNQTGKKKQIDSTKFVCILGSTGIFSEYPGFRDLFGIYLSMNQNAYYWSSTEEDIADSQSICIFQTVGGFLPQSKHSGLTIRCTKDK